MVGGPERPDADPHPRRISSRFHSSPSRPCSHKWPWCGDPSRSVPRSSCGPLPGCVRTMGPCQADVLYFHYVRPSPCRAMALSDALMRGRLGEVWSPFRHLRCRAEPRIIGGFVRVCTGLNPLIACSTRRIGAARIRGRNSLRPCTGRIQPWLVRASSDVRGALADICACC